MLLDPNHRNISEFSSSYSERAQKSGVRKSVDPDKFSANLNLLHICEESVTFKKSDSSFLTLSMRTCKAYL